MNGFGDRSPGRTAGQQPSIFLGQDQIAEGVGFRVMLEGRASFSPDASGVRNPCFCASVPNIAMCATPSPLCAATESDTTSALKASLMTVLERKPLGYCVARQSGLASPVGSPRTNVEGWSAAGATYAEVVKLAEEGAPFALERDARLEHYVPAGKHVAA